MKVSNPKMFLGFIVYGLDWTTFFQLGVENTSDAWDSPLYTTRNRKRVEFV
jgi:hypothetical protein